MAVLRTYSAPSGEVIFAGRFGGFALGNIMLAIWGQSNAIGRADQSDLSAAPLATSDPELASMMAGSFERVMMWTGSAYAPLTAANNGASTGQFGAEFGIAVRWMRETSSGILYLEKRAGSGSSITTFAPVGGSNYSAGRTIHTNASAWLATNSVTIAGKRWAWIQGESDSGQAQEWYESRLADLIAGRVTEGMQASDSISVLAQMKSGSAGYGAGVAAAKAAVAAVDATHRKIVTLEYLKPDNTHCNGRGQVQLGYDIFSAAFGRPTLAA